MTASNTRTVLPIFQFGKLSAPIWEQGLLDLRLSSYQQFLEGGIADALQELPELKVDLPWRCSLTLGEPIVGTPERTPAACVAAGMTFDAPLTVMARMSSPLDEIVEQRLLLCRVPLMDAGGGFVINGVRRVVIHQIVRAPGVWFGLDYEPITGNTYGRGRISPARGPWIGFETNDRDELRVRLNGGNGLSALTVLRLYGFEDDELLETFRLPRGAGRDFMLNTVLLGDCNNRTDALFQLYEEVAPGAPPNRQSAEERIDRLLFNPQNYSLSVVGRHMLNRRFGTDSSSMLLEKDDLVNIILNMMGVSLGTVGADDIDDLANRRVRAVGELVRQEFEGGLYEMARASLEALQTAMREPRRPSDILKNVPLIKRMGSFFNGSKLCQVTDETNPIAELTHKRRVTSLGPGGLNRQNAGVDPRDVHHTHYGKLCPIETPEGQNIGLLCTLTTGADVDEHGLLVTPVRPVRNLLPSHSADLLGRELAEAMESPCGVLESGMRLGERELTELRRQDERAVRTRRFVSNKAEDVIYLNAYQEAELVIGQCDVAMDGLGQLIDDTMEARRGAVWIRVPVEQVDYLDVTPRQVVSASTSLIPFLEHDDANRALMGCNMQRQAVPLLRPQTALVTTGMEVVVARDSGYQVRAGSDGFVSSVTADSITVVPDDGGTAERHELLKGRRSNSFTWIDQRPIVGKFQRVKRGDAVGDGPACREGELALGQRVLVAYMSWGGYNYEDAIILSERIVQAAKFRSRMLKRFRVDAIDSELGSEVITRAVPDVAEWRKAVLSEEGVVPVGAYVKPGQILVGKAAPRAIPAEQQDKELSGEQKLLFAIFGETVDNVRYQDKSLLLPKGQQGKVVSAKVIRKGDGSDAAAHLPPGCHTRVEVEVAGTRTIQPGDKMSGRHGNKGCVSIVVRESDMPFMPDGTPIDVMLSPLGVPSRMNLGQLMEVHLGWAAHKLGFRARTPVFDSASWDEIEQCLAQAWLMEAAGGLLDSRLPEDDVCEPDWKRVKDWCKKQGHSFDSIFGQDALNGTEAGRLCLEMWLDQQGYEFAPAQDYARLREEVIRIDRDQNISAPIFGKQVLRDGRTGEELSKPVMVGYKYMIKLGHMVEDKMHARSTGTYSSITQQPLGGKSAGGGQRLGEMEVWALEGHSAAHVLQEMLTLKSDDVEGRKAMHEAIMAGGDTGLGEESFVKPGMPDSFNLLCAELRSLGLNIEFENEREVWSVEQFIESEQRILEEGHAD